MLGLVDQDYLRSVQYQRGDNLEARIALHGAVHIAKDTGLFEARLGLWAPDT